MIKRLLIIASIFLIVQSASAQSKSYFQVDLGLSQTYKGFFYLFDGIVDVGGGYNRNIFNQLYGGLSFHIDYLSRNNSSARTIVYKPKLNLNYNFKINSWFNINPVVFIGYSFLNISNNEFDYAETQQGMNTGATLRLVWKTQSKIDYYLFGRYDFIYLDEDEKFTQLEYYKKVHLSSFGIGIKIKGKQNIRLKTKEPGHKNQDGR